MKMKEGRNERMKEVVMKREEGGIDR